MTLNEELFEAVRCGLRTRIQQLVADGADVNCANSKDWTPLALAVAGGQYEIARLLSDLGARQDTPSPNGQDVSMVLAAS